jgi:hypothetical protein
MRQNPQTITQTLATMLDTIEHFQMDEAARHLERLAVMIGAETPDLHALSDDEAQLLVRLAISGASVVIGREHPPLMPR